jgi:hypothetical protein
MTYYLTCILFFISGIYGIMLVKYEYITIKWQQICVFFPSILAVAISFAHFLRGPKIPETPSED